MAHLSTLKMHQLRYGELNPADENEARAHVEACPRCAARFNAQESHRAAFVVQPVPEALRAPPAPSWLERLRGWWPAAATLAVALALAAVLLPQGDPLVTEPIPDERIKGAAVEVEAWRDGPTGPERLDEGATVGAGDVLQLRYDPGPHPFATFAGVDSSGVVEVYGTVSAPGESKNGLLRAPFALTLDDSPGRQVFIVMFTESEPSPELTQVVARGEAPVPDGTLRKISLRKR